MVITTPHARAEVKGTKLRLWVVKNATCVTAYEGLVRLTRLSDGAAVDVARGRYAIAMDSIVLSAMPSGPSGAGREARYVEGPVEYREDFSGGLDDWVTGILRRDRDAYVVEPSGAAADLVRLESVRTPRGMSRAMVVRAPEKDGTVTCAVWKGTTDVDAYCFEFDANYGLEGYANFILTDGLTDGKGRKLTVSWDASRVEAGTWHGHRFELFRRTSPSGESYCEIRRFRDGKLLEHEFYYGAKLMPAFMMSKGSITVDNFETRVLTPKADQAPADRPPR
jgi:hypothetical protein